VIITSELIRAARALLRWEQKDLADRSGISLPSIKRLETQPGPLAAQDRTVAALQAAFEAAGVEFTNGGQPGVRMKAKDLSDEDMKLLKQIAELPESRRIRTPFDMPRGCKGLVDKGYAVFQTVGNPQDLLIEITDKGRDALASAATLPLDQLNASNDE
jgi:transcriptional regulator with XRE-family HTH domain